MTKPPKKRGRQSTYNATDAAEIVSRLSRGEPLAVICRDDFMPTDRTVRNWMEADAAFASAIAQARELGFDVIAAECLAIGDDDSRDWEAVRDSEGHVTGIKVDGEHVQRSKLRIDTRLKLLAKWDPKRYGERTLIGSDPDNPLPSAIAVHFIKPDAVDPTP